MNSQSTQCSLCDDVALCFTCFSFSDMFHELRVNYQHEKQSLQSEVYQEFWGKKF